MNFICLIQGKLVHILSTNGELSIEPEILTLLISQDLELDQDKFERVYVAPPL